jgi:hypothetical protein
MSDIFISYASDDRERVRPLAEALRQLGWDVWWDRELLTGRRFDQLIDEQLAVARSVVVVWTSSSVASEWVIEEAQDGKERNILFPVFLDKVKAPRGFRLRHGAELLEGGIDASAATFQKLVADLTALLGVPTKPTAKTKVAQRRSKDSSTSHTTELNAAPKKAPKKKVAPKVASELLAKQALTDYQEDPERGILLGLAAIEEYAWTPRAELALQTSLQASTGEELHALRGHEDWVRSAAFSPNGDLVVTASSDNTARIWDVSTGKELHACDHEDWVWSASFSPNGDLVVTASHDNTARISRIRRGDELLSFARARVSRPLTITERGQYDLPPKSVTRAK